MMLNQQPIGRGKKEEREARRSQIGDVTWRRQGPRHESELNRVIISLKKRDLRELNSSITAIITRAPDSCVLVLFVCESGVVVVEVFVVEVADGSGGIELISTAHEGVKIGVFSAVVEEVTIAVVDASEEVLDPVVVVDVDVRETVFEAREEV